MDFHYCRRDPPGCSIWNLPPLAEKPLDRGFFTKGVGILANV